MVTTSISLRERRAFTETVSSLLQCVSERWRDAELAGDGYDIVAAFLHHAGVVESSSMDFAGRSALTDRVRVLLRYTSEERIGAESACAGGSTVTASLRNVHARERSRASRFHRDDFSHAEMISAFCQSASRYPDAVFSRHNSLRVRA